MTQFINTTLHHWIIIITAAAILSKWCYLSNLLAIGSSSDLALFHAGCRPSLHVGLHLLQHLYPTMGGPAYHHVRKDLHLHPTMGGLAYHHVRKALRLHPTMGGPTFHHVGKAYVYLCLLESSLPLGGNLNLKNTKLLSKVLKLHSGYL